MKLKMVLPKGRMYENVNKLLADAGIHVRGSDRGYRPTSNDPDLELKLLKSQNIPMLVALGQHDCGFAGADWVAEQNAQVTELMDLGFDPVSIVACIPETWDWEDVKRRKIIAASEYRNLCGVFLDEQGVDFTFIRSYGATEVFPPEDADMIVDNTATGTTLEANRLKIVAKLMSSTTRLIAHPRALDDVHKRRRIEDLVLLFRGVLQGRKRVLLEMNCPQDRLDELVAMLPAMRSPTVAKLYSEDSFSVKVAVERDQVRLLIPKLNRAGATDILETDILKVMP